MSYRYFVSSFVFLIVASLLCGSVVATAYAACSNPNQQSCSTDYGVNEVFFGTGGQLCDVGVSGNSTNYCAKSSVGELGVGNTLGSSYQSQAGFNTNREAYLELDITAGGSADLGVLSTGSVATTTTTFQVKSYLASSYYVKIEGNPPSNNTTSPHSLTPLTSGGSSNPGTEQFGINLVANTSPSVGSNITQLPDGTFGFGSVASGYSTADTFRYNSGDTIAQSTKSSGFTQYVISYIFNISPLTPSGQYSYHGSLVATSTF